MSQCCKKNNYILATRRSWNIATYHSDLSSYIGNWTLFTKPVELTYDSVSEINPRYIFFPHWSNIVPQEIIDNYECVCFHETDLPFGRGGSPIQNLIARGFKETKITALKMTSEIDAGPIYSKKELQLLGNAEEIYIRSSKIVSSMIKDIIDTEPFPVSQSGQVVTFARRKPKESILNVNISNIEEVFDHIRMLDADEYPRAFLNIGNLRFELSNPTLRVNMIEASVKITINSVSSPHS